MSKTNIKNTPFTPLFHNVLDEHGITTAAVFGRVWQYCQMERGFCHAEQETIAYQLGINRKTVNLALANLVRSEYLSDITPNTKGRTRIYKDTGKAGGKVYEDVTEPDTEDATLPVTEPVTKSNTNTYKTEKIEKTTTTAGVDAEDFFEDFSQEQKEAYTLIKKVAKHEKAVEIAMRDFPIDSAYDYLQWLVDNTDNRVAQKLIKERNAEERHADAVKHFDDNLKSLQYEFARDVAKHTGDMSHDTVDELWREYAKHLKDLICDGVYEDMYICIGDFYGEDGKQHHDRIEEFLSKRFSAMAESDIRV